MGDANLLFIQSVSCLRAALTISPPRPAECSIADIASQAVSTQNANLKTVSRDGEIPILQGDVFLKKTIRKPKLKNTRMEISRVKFSQFCCLLEFTKSCVLKGARKCQGTYGKRFFSSSSVRLH